MQRQGKLQASADVQRGKALPGIAAVHFAQEGNQYLAAGKADRVVKSDVPIIDIDFVDVPTRLPAN